MKRLVHCVIFAICSHGFHTAAVAAMEIGSKPAQSAQPRAQEPAPKPDVSTGMREGTLTALNIAGGQIQIQGRWHDVIAGKTMVFSKGKQVGVDVLKLGQAIRFNSSIGASGRSTIAAIYVP